MKPLKAFFQLFGWCLIAVFLAGCHRAQNDSSDVSKKNLHLRAGIFHPPGAPSFDLETVNSVKPVLLIFWATWCPSCLKEIPILNQWAARYPDQLAIVAVNVQEEAEVVRSFLLENKVNYSILLDPSGEISDRFEVSAVPSVLLLAKGGEILYYGFRLPNPAKVAAVVEASFNDLEHI